MNIGSFYTGGTSHSMCQDYVLHGEENGMGYVIVSDGCSSSPKSELGARLLSYAARKAILSTRGAVPADIIQSLIIQDLRAAQGILDIRESQVFDATLTVAHTDGKFISVLMFGDGVVYRKSPKFEQIFQIKYSGNAPRYLAYDLDSGRLKNWDALCQDKTVSIYEKVDGVWGEPRTYKEFAPFFSIDAFAENVQSLCVFSDGVESFVKHEEGKESELIPLTEVVSELVSFKNYVGDFVTRRAQSALKKFKKDDISHFDDLTCGAIIL